MLFPSPPPHPHHHTLSFLHMLDIGTLLQEAFCGTGHLQMQLSHASSRGLSTLDPESIHIDLTPQSTSYETGSILDQSTLIFVHKAQLWSCDSIHCTYHSLVHRLVSGYPIQLALDTVCSPYIQQLIRFSYTPTTRPLSCYVDQVRTRLI